MVKKAKQMFSSPHIPCGIWGIIFGHLNHFFFYEIVKLVCKKWSMTRATFEELTLDWTQLYEGEHVFILRQFAKNAVPNKVTSISFKFFDITDQLLKYISVFKNLKELHLVECNPLWTKLIPFPGFLNVFSLTYINFKNTKYKEDQLSIILNSLDSTNIIKLDLEGTFLKKNHLKTLSSFTNIKDLTLTEGDIEDTGFIKGMSSLTSFDISNPTLNTLIFPEKSKLNSLYLVNNPNLDNFSLSAIWELKNLKHLNIAMCPKVSSKGFIPIVKNFLHSLF